tara:strand:- start:659 stop:937 length:279 start_codon:yes stop_codon:yes gene_type:complete
MRGVLILNAMILVAVLVGVATGHPEALLGALMLIPMPHPDITYLTEEAGVDDDYQVTDATGFIGFIDTNDYEDDWEEDDITQPNVARDTALL